MLSRIKHFFTPHHGPRIAIIQMHGQISTKKTHINIDNHGPLIEKAFSFVKARGKRPAGYVILDIDSPGGSPVQSALNADLIVRKAREHNVRTCAVIGDVGASGGYWIAAAADKIYVNRMSLVGSIGIVGGGFGFPKLLAKHGIERRVYTAGERKSKLDPFREEDPKDLVFINNLLGETHEIFKQWIMSRRGDRITKEVDIFNGDIWGGEAAVKYGLADGLGDIRQLVAKLGGEDPTVKRLTTEKKGLLSRLIPQGLPGSASISAASIGEAAPAIAEAVLDVLEEKAAFRLKM